MKNFWNSGFRSFARNFTQRVFSGQSQRLHCATAMILLSLQLQVGNSTLMHRFFGSRNVHNDEQVQKKSLEQLRDLKKYEIAASKDLTEGQILEATIQDGNNMYPIILVRWKGRVYALGGVCTYDGKTKLADGVCFGNKLYCPMHGCAYNITSGQVEYCPAIDDLPRFFAEEKNQKISVYAPTLVPKRLIPYTFPRDYNDMRKVVIIGFGAAAFGCIETLRKNGYQGEILVITRSTTYPFDKTRLTKQFKNVKYEDLLLRDDEWFQMNSVNVAFGRECSFIDKTHGKQHILLEDGTRVEYDVLVLANGSEPVHRKIEGVKRQVNVSYLNDLKDHKRISAQLDTAQSVTILGGNFWALETAATIRREYKNVKDIYIIDPNKTMWLEEKLGPQIARRIIDEHLENDVSFVLRNPVDKVIGDDQKIKTIQFQNGLKLNTDLLLLFPSTEQVRHDWKENSEMDQMEYTERDHLRCNIHGRTGYKRILAAGNCAATTYFATNDRIPNETWNSAYHQGETCAYTALALRIPWHQVPFMHSKQYEKVLQYVGYAPYFNEVYIEGDVDKWDFIAYYGLNGHIIAAAGTPNHKRSMQIINEGLRLESLPLLPEIKSKKQTLETIEQDIRKLNKSGCYREEIFNVRYDPVEKDVMWMHRDRQDEYHNFYKEGLVPTEQKVDNDE